MKLKHFRIRVLSLVLILSILLAALLLIVPLKIGYPSEPDNPDYMQVILSPVPQESSSSPQNSPEDPAPAESFSPQPDPIYDVFGL